MIKNQDPVYDEDGQIIYASTKCLAVEKVRRSAEYVGQSLHRHPYYELEYIVSGTRTMQIDKDYYDLSKGTFTFAGKGKLHRGFPKKDMPREVELYNVYFFDEDIENITRILGNEFYELLSNRVILIPTARQSYVEELLSRMALERIRYDDLSDGMIKSHLFELLTFLLRMCRQGNDNYLIPQSEDSVMSEVITFIQENLHEKLSLEEVASRFGFSTSYFSRKFKNQTGSGFCDYVRNVRLDEATNLLNTTNLSITQIASRCGFESSNYFGDVYRKERGIAPRNLRKLKA